MPAGSPLPGECDLELEPATPTNEKDMFDLLEQGVGGSALKSLSPVSKNAPHSRCSVKRVRGEKSGQVLYHMYKEGGGAHPPKLAPGSLRCSSTITCVRADAQITCSRRERPASRTTGTLSSRSSCRTHSR